MSKLIENIIKEAADKNALLAKQSYLKFKQSYAQCCKDLNEVQRTLAYSQLPEYDSLKNVLHNSLEFFLEEKISDVITRVDSEFNKIM